MQCPTCDHTMAQIVADVFHCERCGTVRVRGGADYVPKLVERCRDFEAEFFNTSSIHMLDWKKLGIAESIRPFRLLGPEDRP